MITLSNPFKVATCTKYYTLNGGPVADVEISGGGIYKGVPLRLLGTGSLFPCKAGDAVHLYFPDGRADLPYIIGVDYKDSEFSTETAEATGDADYTPDIKDLILKHENNTVSLSSSGVSIDSAQSIRLQLPTGSALRISSNGETSDLVLNGQAFINEVYSLLENLSSKQDLLYTALNAFSLALEGIVLTQVPASALKTALSGKGAFDSPTVSESKASAENTLNEQVKLP